MKYPMVLDSSLRAVRALYPEKISVNENLAPLSDATIDGARELCQASVGDLVRVDTGDGSPAVYRVQEAEETEPGRVTLYMQHAMCTLADAIMPGKSTKQGSASELLAELLGAQTEVWWALGTVEVPEDRVLKWECDYTNVLQGLCDLLDELSGYALGFDMTSKPFTLSVLALSDEDGCECRLNRNIQSLTVTEDRSELCTRLYPTNGGAPIDADTIGEYGVISRSLSVEKGLTAEEIQAEAQRMFEAHKHPAVTVTIDAHDLSAITGEAMDALVPGRVCRVCLPDRGRTIRQRIISRAYADLLGEPGRVTLTLATEGSSAVGQLAGLVVDTTVQRRLVERGIEGLDELTIATNENLNLVSENINVLGKKVTVNAEQISLKASKEIVDGLVEDYANIDINIDQILAQIYQNGEVMTEINATVNGIDAWSKDTEGNLADLLVTANGIKAQVTDVEGNVGKLQLASDEFRTTLQNGDTVLSQIRQLQDEISQTVNDANGTIGALTVKADSITGKITSADDRISQLVVKTDGLTYTLEQNSETLALFDVNQQHMLTQIGSAASSIGNLEVTANAITQKVEDVSKGVGQFQVTADSIKGSVTSLDGRVGKLELTSDQFQTTITGLDGRVGNLELRSDRFDVAIGKDGLGGKISMIEGLLDLKVEGGGNTVSVRLNAMDNSISLKADTTYVNKLVADEITAVKGSFDELLAGYVTTENVDTMIADMAEGYALSFSTTDLYASDAHIGATLTAEHVSANTVSADNINFGSSSLGWNSRKVLTSAKLDVTKKSITYATPSGGSGTLEVVIGCTLTPSNSTINYLG